MLIKVVIDGHESEERVVQFHDEVQAGICLGDFHVVDFVAVQRNRKGVDVTGLTNPLVVGYIRDDDSGRLQVATGVVVAGTKPRSDTGSGGYGGGRGTWSWSDIENKGT